MYLSEIAPQKIRGSLGSLYALGTTLGVVFGTACGLEELLGTNDKWHYALSIYGILVAFAMALYPFFLESPKYLYAIAKQKQKSIDGRFSIIFFILFNIKIANVSMLQF